MAAVTKQVRASDKAGDRAELPTIESLIREVSGYMQPADVDIIRQAYEVAEEAHRGQTRRSGEPYITHPLSTALILADLRMDVGVVAAGLLHDVPEDTSVPIATIQAKFGDEVAHLVDGVTKLSRLSWPGHSDSRVSAKGGDDEAEAWAESMRKMFLAMAEDVRVVLIKLADRMHNMATLIHMPPASRRRIAQETMDIYAPLASRLGIWQLKWQLEDLAFRHLEPEKYKETAALLASRRPDREGYITTAVKILQEELAKAGLEAEVAGRPKHIYSIYRKMQRRGVEFNQIYDLLAVRVLVDEVSDCYSALGVVHALWHPIPGQFDDYIAMPKESLYQSLHTSVIGPEGKPLEIQIRTHLMHRVAEYGVAAHWRYKEGTRRDLKFEEKIAWLRQLLDWQKEMAGAQEFVESLKTDVFQDQVYVFTPKGAIRELPAGATPLDFAYRIHTDIGHRCIGAKINQRLVPLDYQLQNGDIIEILTSKTPKGPSRDWLNSNLNFVKTAHAKEKIRQWFRREQREENILRGRELVDKELARLGLTSVKLDEIAELFRFERVDDLLAAVGCGEVSTQSIATKLITPEPTAANLVSDGLLAPVQLAPPVLAKGVQVMGVGDLLSRIARCCNPVPGEPIIGYITRGSGVTVHRSTCPNVLAEDEPHRLVPVEWGRTPERVYPVNIRLEAWDRDGLLKDFATVVSEDHISVSSMSAVSHPDNTATIRATLEIGGIAKLSRILSRIEGLKGVMSVRRESN
jgi:GTP diphosphokinase / guanosine-3',5'-bis(diphosphate) 3'-diphosphatase